MEDSPHIYLCKVFFFAFLRRVFSGSSVGSCALICALSIFFLTGSCFAAAPTQATQIADTVTNPATGQDVIVIELILDPADSGAVPLELAYVRTSDDYLILVKNQVGDLLYTYDANDNIVMLEVVSTDPISNTAQLRPTADPTAATSPIDYSSPWSGGTAGAGAQNITQTSSTGVHEVNIGQGGSNGGWGTLFIPPTAGGNGGTGATVNYVNTTAVTTAANIGFEAGSIGGAGGKGGNSYASFWSGRPGGSGGKGGVVTITNSTDANITTSGTKKSGIYAYSRSGKAGAGGSGYVWSGSGAGGHSSDGGNVTVTNHAVIITTGIDARGIYGLSMSGNGGISGNSWGIVGSAASGSSGGNGGNVSLSNTGTIWTSGQGAHAVFGQSIGGTGGDSGSAGGVVALAGSGSAGGDGGNVSINNRGVIVTDGNEARGLFAQSIGGGGGTGQGILGLVALGSSGLAGGSAGDVRVNNQIEGDITTHGQYADAIFAQSVGGGGGTGSGSLGVVALGGTGSSGGTAGQVSVTNNGNLTTSGNFARSIFAQSIGGGGGAGGGSGGLVAIGGSSTSGSDAGEVNVTSNGNLLTTGEKASAVYAQSIGGGGGYGASSGGPIAIGGSGTGGGKGAAVKVKTSGTIETNGDQSFGVFAQSIGGGGGDGGTTGGMVTIGGSAGIGNHGGNVLVTHGGEIFTAGEDSAGIFAQSVGGGGGNGGSGYSGSWIAGFSLGGSGAAGGLGGDVEVDLQPLIFDGSEKTVLIATKGDRSTGIMAQSIGGGGGNGGIAVQGSWGGLATISVAIGGSGGSGGLDGLGGTVELRGKGNVTTTGNNAAAVILQSVGGGGGNGGTSVAGAISGGDGIAIGMAVGGSAGSGGVGGSVVARFEGELKTSGAASVGFLAQSVGGGGGNGGTTVAGSAGLGAVLNGELSVAVGGSGGDGGDGGDLFIAKKGSVATLGNQSDGLLIQSIGGGGGNGGTVVSAGGGTAVMGISVPISVGVGGSGGSGGAAGEITATIDSDVATAGDGSDAVIIQSIGGGGGNGGLTVAASGSVAGGFAIGVNVGVGGTGGSGGDGQGVAANYAGTLITRGDHSVGLLAQTVGGGGGNAGGSIAAGLNAAVGGGGNLNASIGGSGGAAGDGGVMTLESSGAIETFGKKSTAMLAQSIGGGGGNGGFSIAGGLGVGIFGSAEISAGIGGFGSGGGSGGAVTTRSKNTIITHGNDSAGMLSQSIGGGGGNGAFSVSSGGAGAVFGTGAVNFSLGGFGSSAGNAATVNARAEQRISTLGSYSTAFLAQSIGGGGGNGGFSVSGNGAVAFFGSGNGSLGIGGGGAGGGDGAAVIAAVKGNVSTLGKSSGAVLAQSVGGGGGNGGFNVELAGSAAWYGTGSVGVGVGGSGSGGGQGSTVTLQVGNVDADINRIDTQGDNSVAILAQSVGGGGGNGGFNVSISASVAGYGNAAGGVGVGGTAGGGGNAAAVTTNVTADITTGGDSSVGLLTQSVGGGGGNGGFNIAVSGAGSGTGSGGAVVGVGGLAGGGGTAGKVNNTLVGNVTTSGDKATAVLAQSVGGGGGNGGFNVAGFITAAKNGAGGASIAVGGVGGGGGRADIVSNNVTGTIITGGDDSGGVLAQSIGGGGGNGGFSLSGAVALAGDGSGALSVGVGGVGGGGGMSAAVTNSVSGKIYTAGENSFGTTAQSIGGGGGNGGVNVTGAFTAAKTGTGAVAIGVGGVAGGGGNSAAVNNTLIGYVQTLDKRSTAILTQSVGGGGGNGGVNVTGTFTGAKQGSGNAAIGVGGFGGNGGSAGLTTSILTGGAVTTGDDSVAILTQSIGGGGGNGGVNVSAGINYTHNYGGTLGLGLGGFGGGGGNAGNVSSRVNTTATYSQIGTTGDNSSAIIAQSIGGGGGTGGVNVGAGVNITGKTGLAIGLGVGGFGGGGGNAGSVIVHANGLLVTEGDNSSGLIAQSIGGGGGNGGVNVAGTLSFAYLNNDKQAALATSIGVGGFGGSGGQGSDVKVNFRGTIVAQPRTLIAETVDTATGSSTPEHYEYNIGEGSHGLLAQSIGGGGGNGGVNVSAGLSVGSGKTDGHALFVGVGGFGGGGGNAGDVDVKVDGNGTTDIISSYGDGYAAIAAQSIGGGGGNGTLNISGGLVSDSPISIGVGGLAGSAGTGGNVKVSNTTNIFAASGDIAPQDSGAIILQSIVDAVVGVVDELTSGDANIKAIVDAIVGPTEPEHSAGIMALSIGGGGGNGGVNVSGGLSISKEKLPSVTFGIGGFGGAAARSGNVTVSHSGDTEIVGEWTHGILAQSIAGGGGNGGFNASTGLNLGDTSNSGGALDFTAVIGIGGLGGQGADAGNVTVDSSGKMTLAGNYSRGIFAQSIGGGGGNGGMNVNGLFASNSSPISIGIGGSGLGGGDAGDISVTRGSATQTAGKITTMGEGALGIEASSIGGGGGDAGMNFQLGVSLAGSSDGGVKKQSYGLVVAVGGSGAEAGHAGKIAVNNYSDISTFGNNSFGLLGQSIGGGGGNAHINLALAYHGKSEGTKGLNIAIGGGTGNGGSGNRVDVNHDGSLETWGWGSYGILAQSIGGGGGNTSMNTAFTKENGKINVSIGSIGGNGGKGDDVALTSRGQIKTHGVNAYGLLAQSIGNGGGNSSAISLSLATSAKKEDKTTAKSFALSVGLNGGQGGSAGDVVLTADGLVATEGRDSHAIIAQSLGGGGGNGGGAGGMGLLTSTTAALSIGATGGQGGAGGAVTVASSATVSTRNHNSIGILAQSVGGGGGTGGGGGGPSIKSESSSVRIAIGGSGGTGMRAGAVKVSNSGTVTTNGGESHGLLAQSLGGGGGNGGLVLNEVLYHKAGKDPRTHVSASIGGSGGTGGTGGSVDVTNQGNIVTLASDSVGILAQSIGGGGGNGSTVITGSLMGKAGNNVYLGIGGSGGQGGTAGNVKVTNLDDASGNAAVIKTYADNSHGILAMSVGGGGGNGSTTITTSAAGKGSKDDKTTVTFDLSVGGLGGTGGVSGNTRVENAGSITTLGKGAHGIIAQSIGGGGGNGGLAISGDLSLGATGKTGAKQHTSTVALGGWGGIGNNAGDVVVKNSGTIEVKGDNSYGIYAQSVGGGGGNGGFAAALSRNLLTNPFQLGVLEGALLNIGVGGSGGAGGSGGNVNIDHTGSIIAHGDNAYGIYAQTVAGGGGNMSYSLSSPVWMAAGLATNITLGLVRDAIDKAYDTTGKVTLNSTGDITMYGENSRAFQVQTINGGGGNLNLFMDVSERAVEIGADGIEVPSNDPMLSNVLAHILAPVQVGAKLAWKAAGGDLIVDSAGIITTFGTGLVASQLQSIGGGGGSTVMNYMIEKSVDTLYKGSTLAIDLLAGAKDTFGSTGGTVSAKKKGGIYTTNKNAQGASYQSVGGGGGHIIVNVTSAPKQEIAAPGSVTKVAALLAEPVLSANPGATATVALGAVASTDNNGGDLDISNIGETLTQGAYSAGLILQSIGGGGADAHLNGLDALAVTIGGREGTSGNGGNIQFANSGAVATAGERSHGIILQSIGGGGGALFSDLDPGAIELNLSNESSGNGGDLNFTQQGRVQTLGAGTYGVLAQSIGGGGGLIDRLFAGSAGGSGSGGDINLTFADDVVTSGTDSIGIFMQSAGGTDAVNGDIDLALNGTLVMGGSRAGVGVNFSGGRDNRLTNHAALLTVDGTTGMAILGTTGNEWIDNFATVVGNVDLGGGRNSFINHQGARYLSGAVASLGSAGQLLNAGVLTPGGPGNPQTTTLSGDFIQSSTGEYLVDLDFASNRADRISASGRAEVGGQISLNLLHPDSLLPGKHQLIIVSGAGGMTENTTALRVPPSAVVNYQLVMPDAVSLAVGMDIDFAPVGLDDNLTAIGNYFNQLQLSGGSEAMAPVVTQIFNLSDDTSLAETYDFMNPNYFDNFTSTALDTVRPYTQSLLGRLQTIRLTGTVATGVQQSISLSGGDRVLLAFNGSDASVLQLFSPTEQPAKKYGFWLNGFGQKGNRSAGDGYDGYQFSSRGVMIGLDSLLSRKALGGVSLGYTQTDLNVDSGRSDGDIESLHGSLYGSYFSDTLYIDGVVSYASQDYTNKRLTRVLSLDRQASSQHDGHLWSAYAETGYSHKMQQWLLQPFAALNYSYLDEEGFSETGAGILSLRVENRSTEALVSDLGGRLARVFDTSTGILTAELSASWNYDFSIDDQILIASFAGAPGGSFAIRGRKPERNGALLGLGLNAIGKSGVYASLQFNKEYRKGYQSLSMMGKLRITF